jgi:hypothetical protein
MINNSRVKCISKEDVNHLIVSLQLNYTLTKDLT